MTFILFKSTFYTQLMDKKLTRQQSYKSSLAFLTAKKAQITELKKSPEKAIEILNQITKRVISGDHIGVLIALYNNESLLRLFETSVALHKQSKSQQIQKSMEILYIFAYDCFFAFINPLKDALDYFKAKSSKFRHKLPYTDFTLDKSRNQRYELFRELSLQFYKIKNSKEQAFEKGKKLNKYIDQKLRQELTSAFEECIFTWLKINIEELQEKNIFEVTGKQPNKSQFCCKIHFEANKTIEGVDISFQNFRKDTISTSANNQHEAVLQNIKTHVVSSLNSNGGIYYLGINYAVKNATFLGIPINQKQKQQILRIILQEIVLKIYPSDDERDSEDEKQEEIRLEKFRKRKLEELKNEKAIKNEHEINRFITVDFINVYNKQTWFYERDMSIIKYIVKIKIKVGDQYEVYHFINEKDTPQAFIRDNKLSMIEYYEEVYRKLRNKANNKHENIPKKELHPLCRFILKSQQRKQQYSQNRYRQE